jgi:hypothetical protein
MRQTESFLFKYGEAAGSGYFEFRFRLFMASLHYS